MTDNANVAQSLKGIQESVSVIADAASFYRQQETRRMKEEAAYDQGFWIVIGTLLGLRAVYYYCSGEYKE